MTYHVIIFEDSKFDRAAIRSFLEKIPEIKIIGFYETSKEILSKCGDSPIDLVIADGDIHGDKMAGARLVKQLKTRMPKIKVLGLTFYQECMQAMRRAGADYVVLKQFLEDEKDAEKYIREALFNIDEMKKKKSPPELTIEEDRVLRRIAAGQTEKEIGNDLGYTRRQIRDIKERLFNKFGADNVASLIALAYQTGYLDPDTELETT